MLALFKIAPTRLKREGEDKVWKGGYHLEIVETKQLIQQKVNHIPINPVEEKKLTQPEDYFFSSARK